MDDVDIGMWTGPLQDHRQDGQEFGGVTNVPVEGHLERIELYRERWEQGLDIWTGEPIDGIDLLQRKDTR